MIKKSLTLISLILILTGCKIDFTGDLYTSDLIDLANSIEDKKFIKNNKTEISRK